MEKRGKEIFQVKRANTERLRKSAVVSMQKLLNKEVMEKRGILKKIIFQWTMIVCNLYHCENKTQNKKIKTISVFISGWSKQRHLCSLFMRPVLLWTIVHPHRPGTHSQPLIYYYENYLQCHSGLNLIDWKSSLPKSGSRHFLTFPSNLIPVTGQLYYSNSWDP